MNKQEKHEIINNLAEDIKYVYDEIIEAIQDDEYTDNLSKDFIEGATFAAREFKSRILESIKIEHLCVEAGVNTISESQETYQKFLEAYNKYLNRIEDGEWK